MDLLISTWFVSKHIKNTTYVGRGTLTLIVSNSNKDACLENKTPLSSS